MPIVARAKIGGHTMPDAVAERVIALIAKKKKLAPESLTAETTFAEIGVDSLDAMDLLFTFEDEYTITIPDDVAQQMRTVGQAIEALRRALAERTPEAG